MLILEGSLRSSSSWSAMHLRTHLHRTYLRTVDGFGTPVLVGIGDDANGVVSECPSRWKEDRIDLN